MSAGRLTQLGRWRDEILAQYATWRALVKGVILVCNMKVSTIGDDTDTREQDGKQPATGVSPEVTHEF